MLVTYLVATGCYDPSVRDCAIECADPGDCVDGQACQGGWCVSPGAAACTSPPAGPDGGTPVTSDASRPDASDVALCTLGCTNGTCDAAGVCVIDCSATSSCPDDLFCPPNIPCRVVCGDSACGHHVTCGLATSCEVQCLGYDSCKDEIRCGAAPCTVTCSGDNSCSKRTKCSGSCACNVTCTGEDACDETHECPMSSACRLGDGCSSALPGCNTCGA